MIKQFIRVSLFLFSVSVLAQDLKDVDLSTPYGAVFNSLYYLHDDHLDPIKAGASFRMKGTPAERAEIATKLKQILDGEGIIIDLEKIPKDINHLDSISEKNRYILSSEYPLVYVERRNGKWQYPEASVKRIEELHKEVFKYGTDRLLLLLPRLGTQSFFGLYMYQYISILMLVLLCFTLHKLLSFLLELIILRIVLRAGYENLADHFLLPVARPISILFILKLLALFIPVLQLPAEISHYSVVVIQVLLPLFATVVFYRFVNVFARYLEHVARKTDSTLDDQVVPLLRKTLKTFVVIIGTLFILTNLDIDIIPLLTGLSIGGLAFALAAQDTIKNFFGSLMIFLDKPFQIGDWITAGEIDGNVEEVGFRSSRVRTFRNSVMYVPNSKLADSMIDNHGLRQYRRYYTQLALQYDTPPALIESFITGLETIVKDHPNTRKDYYNIYLNDMAAYSLNVMFYIFFEVPDWPAELKARQEIILEILKLADKLGVQFAFPTQTLHMENFPGKPSLSATYMSEGEMQTVLQSHFQKK